MGRSGQRGSAALHQAPSKGSSAAAWDETVAPRLRNIFQPSLSSLLKPRLLCRAQLVWFRPALPAQPHPNDEPSRRATAWIVLFSCVHLEEIHRGHQTCQGAPSRPMKLGADAEFCLSGCCSHGAEPNLGLSALTPSIPAPQSLPVPGARSLLSSGCFPGWWGGGGWEAR